MKKRLFTSKASALKGFTLLELIVVIAIIVIMSSIIVPNVIGRRRLARIESANDQAYSIYIATQDYLNYLQKYNYKASDFFGNYKASSIAASGGAVSVGSNTKSADQNVGFLACNGGIMATNSFGAYKDPKPTNENLERAFLNICGKRMNHHVIDHNGKDLKGNSASPGLPSGIKSGAAGDYTINGDGGSFLIIVYPDTYAVRNVYYTTYMTQGEYKEASENAIWYRITGKFNFDDGNASNTGDLLFRGFSSTFSTGQSNYFSQEYITDKSLGKKQNNTTYPCYMGQYPIPAYTLQ